jgi:hypothetical protein
MYGRSLVRVLAAILKMADISKILKMQNCSSNGSREATHRFRTSNNAKSNPEIKGSNSIKNPEIFG